MGLRAERSSHAAEIVPACLTVGGVPFLADPSGALYHEGEGALLVADLHLEKGSSFARRGMLLPPYDTGETLLALGDVVARYAPRIVIALGDSFHDPHASARLADRDRTKLAALQMGRHWLWLSGNHDPLPHATVAGDVAAEARIGPLTLRHEPQAGHTDGEIAGHLHPVARVLASGGVARRRCFFTDGRRCIMPAFGAYAGGLNIQHAAFQPLFGPQPRMAHALGRDRVYAIPLNRCVADG